MEIIIGAIITVLTSLVKKINNKCGNEIGKSITILIVFFLSFIGALLYKKGVINPQIIADMGKISAYAIAIHEVIYKRIILPIFNQIETSRKK